MSGPDGVFLGVMSRRIDPVNFEKFFASVALGDGAAIAMFHRDGTMLARYPHADQVIGQKFSKAPLLNKVLTNGGLQTLRVRSPVDGQDRLGAAAPLRRFPVVMGAYPDNSSALADLRGENKVIIGAALVAALAITFSSFAVGRE